MPGAETVTGMAEAMALLAAERRERGLRQVDIAAATGMCQQEISRHEQGRYVTFRALVKYADALGYDVDLVLRKRSESADEPQVNTKEQNIAFRKAWDARVDAGRERET